MKILGLDLGISSIGWAWLEEDNENFILKDWGSRIFEAGMEDDIASGKGVSRCTERRLKRALRIQYRRRRDRKNGLIKILTENGFLPNPLTPDFFTEIDNRLLMAFPLNIRRQVGHVLPYLYRKKALDTKLAKDELGRTLYHLAQRRGYLSNRKQDLKNEEESGVVKSGINQLKQEMAVANARTLGEYFSSIDPEKTKIRGRYTDRSMFQDEFRKICAAQRDLISPELEEKLYQEIFFQRKLKSCKNLIGECRVYPDLKRCSYFHEEAQLFRIYTTAAHLRIEKKGIIRSLSDSEHEKVIETLNGFSPLLTNRGTVVLSKLAKEIGLEKGAKFTLADEEKEIYGNQLHAILYRVFGGKAAQMTGEEQRKFLNDLSSIENDDVLKKRLLAYWHLSEEKADDAMRIPLPDDYCAYSLKAIKELLPDLKANIPLKTIEKLNHPLLPFEPLAQLPFLDSDECGIDLRNPLVHRVLTELRHVVNAIINRYGKPDRIHVELARDLKSSNKERMRMTMLNRDREKERAAIAAKIAKEAGLENPSRNDILKVMLAEECNYTCPYTGIQFNMYDLLHGKDIHIEHIIPFSRSFDDSFRNKTLCEASANQAKNNRTPYEAFSGETYQKILQRVAHFKGTFAEDKKRLFECEKIDEQAFLERNLNDTRYASKLAMQYLALLYGGIVDKDGKRRIFAVAGGCTALIRRAWGGNYLLGEGEKVRTDHRHHAIDALTIALTSVELVKKVASMSPEQRRKIRESKKPFIGNALFDQAEKMLASATVSHHTVNKMRGILHNETFYSKDYGASERHVRTKLSMLAAADIANIIDPAIKNAVMEKLGMTSGNTKISDSDLKIFEDEKNLPILRDKKGNFVNTVKFVRVRKNKETRTIGTGDRIREVANGVNYLLAVFAETDAFGNETAWKGEIVSLFDAVSRKKDNLPIFEKNRPGLKFKFTLKKGDIVSWVKDGQTILCVIRGISLPQFYMVPVNDARMQKELKAAKLWFAPTLSAAFKGHLQKFRMNIFGELQNSND